MPMTQSVLLAMPHAHNAHPMKSAQPALPTTLSQPRNAYNNAQKAHSPRTVSAPNAVADAMLAPLTPSAPNALTAKSTTTDSASKFVPMAHSNQNPTTARSANPHAPNAPPH